MDEEVNSKVAPGAAIHGRFPCWDDEDPCCDSHSGDEFTVCVHVDAGQEEFVVHVVVGHAEDDAEEFHAAEGEVQVVAGEGDVEEEG